MADKISTQMRKGILEYIILWLINQKDIYGAEILDVLANSDLIVVEWTIYPLLSRLKKEELISYYWVESESGHPRKYYKLTSGGKDTLIVMEKTWWDIKSTIWTILNK